MILDEIMATVSASLLTLFFAVETVRSFKEGSNTYSNFCCILACLFLVATLINISML